MKTTCETCPHWVPGEANDPKRMANDGKVFGNCRRYPVPDESCGVLFVQHPMSHPDNYCGEHPGRRKFEYVAEGYGAGRWIVREW